MFPGKKLEGVLEVICVWRTREGFDACAKAALEAPVKLAVSLGGPAAADSAVQDWSCEVDAEVIDADLDTWSLERDESPALSVRTVGRHASRMLLSAVPTPIVLRESAIKVGKLEVNYRFNWVVRCALISD